MRKLPPTPRRHRLAFDPLEGRQLLNGQPMGGMHPDSSWFPGPHSIPYSDSTMGPQASSGPAFWASPAPPVGQDQGPTPGQFGPDPGGTASGGGSWGGGPGDGDPSGSPGLTSPPASASTGTPSPGLSSSGTGPLGGTPATSPTTDPSSSSSSAPGLAASTGASGAAGSSSPATSVGPFGRGGESANPFFWAYSSFLYESMALGLASGRADFNPPGAILAAPLESSGSLTLTGPQAPGSTNAPAAVSPATSQAPMASPVVPVGPAASQAIGGDSEAASVELSNGAAPLEHAARGGRRFALHAGRSLPFASRSDRGPIAAEEAEAAATDLAPSLDPRPDDLLREAHGADLIADALPVAGESLEKGLEDFVRQLEAVDVAGIVSRGPTPGAYATVAVAGLAACAIAGRELVRRRTRHGGRFRVVDPLGRELALSFPELPRGWSGRR